MLWLPKNPNFWLGAFLFWLVSLFTLSSFRLPGPEAPSIPHIDKVIHFGFFYGGSGLLCAYLFWRRTDRVNWKLIIGTAIMVFAVIGASDEWHQSFTPGRSGNDRYDWLADVLGAAAGAFTFKGIHRWLK